MQATQSGTLETRQPDTPSTTSPGDTPRRPETTEFYKQFFFRNNLTHSFQKDIEQ